MIPILGSAPSTDSIQRAVLRVRSAALSASSMTVSAAAPAGALSLLLAAAALSLFSSADIVQCHGHARLGVDLEQSEQVRPLRLPTPGGHPLAFRDPDRDLVELLL